MYRLEFFSSIPYLFLILPIIVATSVFPPVIYDPTFFTPSTTMPPPPCFSYQFESLVLVNELFIFGGECTDPNNPNLYVYSYSGSTRTWSLQTQLPHYADSFTTVAISPNEALILGGWCKPNNTKVSQPCNQVWLMTINNTLSTGQREIIWSELTNDAPWAPRINHGSVVWNSNIILAGGEVGTQYNYSNDVWLAPTQLNESIPGSLDWRRMPDAEWGGHSLFGLVVYRNQLILTAGVSHLYPNDDVWILSDWTTGWIRFPSTQPTFPGRHQHMMVVYRDQIILCGGLTIDDLAALSDVYTFNGTTWMEVRPSTTAGTQFFTPRHDSATIVYGDQLFLIGGFGYPYHANLDVYIMGTNSSIPYQPLSSSSSSTGTKHLSSSSSSTSISDIGSSSSGSASPSSSTSTNCFTCTSTSSSEPQPFILALLGLSLGVYQLINM